MPARLLPRRSALEGAGVPSSREGRDCEASHRLTTLLLLPDARPGAWLVLLAATCTYVAVRALELGLH